LTINRGIPIVELIKFEPVTRSIGTRKRLFYLKLFFMMTVFGKISLFEFEFLNNIHFCLFFLKSMALTRRMGTKNYLFYLKNLSHLLEIKFELRNS